MNRFVKIPFDIFRLVLIPCIFIVLFIFELIPLIALVIALVCFAIIFLVVPVIFRYNVAMQRIAVFLHVIGLPRSSKLKDPVALGLYATRNFYLKHKDNVLSNTKKGEESLNKIQEVTLGVWHVLPIYVAKCFSKELQLSSKAMDSVLSATSNPKYPPHNSQISEKDESTIKADFPLVTKDNERQFYEKIMQLPGSTIVLYLHGNTSNRAFAHRTHLYKVLRKLGCHVVAFDYRGFGDSEKIPPSETGVVKDALAVYNYIRSITNNPVFIWGHSLGTAISTHMLANLTEMSSSGPEPKALILESPFTNIREQARLYPAVTPFRLVLPWFDYMFVKPLIDNDMGFNSELYIRKFTQPVLILHAEDDCIVPFKLGNKLYKSARTMREGSMGPLEFHRFKVTSCYGHAFLYRAPNLPELVTTFFNVYNANV